ncbi:universal stress protein [Saccharopolyspora gloriosae]|uniref:Nucleotide-binding universal stress UspA family protein n=2 Tax=Saccharopolyspora gloriosae TaxID=455344 RepID=A0A840NCJ2_9PSEU|nr:universal stress protein [Saccharopolyspora gloriosae]MBB5070016.1 nucleotide-binding universal stress UspA family protein [Saccharopolyspora gloriosae]
MAWEEGGIVVGVDGSEQSIAALSWAAVEAGRRRTDRVHAFVINDFPAQDDQAWKMLETIAGRVRADNPSITISEVVTRGRPAAALIDMSWRTQLIVVGARGRNTAVGTLLGSVSTKVATHAHCPVAVVREPRTEGPVYVGVDSSPHSQDALEFAFAAAAARRSELVALQIWDVPGPDISIVPPLPDEIALAEADAQRSIAEQLAGWSERYPEVSLVKAGQRGHPVIGLTERAREAQLLVVGHRGRGGFAGLLLGSVAAGVLQHARCPVAVVRGDKHNIRP